VESYSSQLLNDNRWDAVCNKQLLCICIHVPSLHAYTYSSSFLACTHTAPPSLHACTCTCAPYRTEAIHCLANLNILADHMVLAPANILLVSFSCAAPPTFVFQMVVCYHSICTYHTDALHVCDTHPQHKIYSPRHPPYQNITHACHEYIHCV
jgi:hypothetical protein